MKYLLFFLCVVVLKYLFYREGLYDKRKIRGGINPNVSKINDDGRKTNDLVNKKNKVEPDILDRQISAINVNDIPLFYK